MTGSRRKAKRITAAGVAASLLLLTAGCGAGGLAPVDGTLTLALRAGTYAEVVEQALPEFEEKYGVTCEVLALSEDELHSLVAEDAKKTEGAYDLCMVDGSWMAEYTANGVLADFSEFGYTLDTDVIPATTTICIQDGGTYLAPYYGNVTVLLFNKELVAAAGYDGDGIASLDDMLAICQKAEESGRQGFLYRGDTENNIVVDFLPILLSFGGWVVDEENRPTVDTPAFRDAMDYYLELIATGGAAAKDDLIEAVGSGQAAMAIGWPGWYYPEEDSEADYRPLTGRVHADSEAHNANVYGIWAIGVSANSPNRKLAAKLVEHLMDPKVARESVPYGGVPCRYSSLRDERVLKDYPQYNVICEAIENGVYRPLMEQWPEFYTILGAEMRKIIDRETTTQEGLAEAQAALIAANLY